MVLYMIGLGLGDADDITVKGLKIVQSADLVFLEAYTSVLLDHAAGTTSPPLSDDPQSSSSMDDTAVQLQQAYQCVPITVADRDLVEQEAEARILEPARTQNVAFLVVGDPVCATTHTDLWLRCQQLGIPVQTIHNASIMGAVGSCGLQLYNFGQTVSIPFFDDHWRPVSFYPKIQYNRRGGMHTLCLLDIKVKEPDFEAMKKGKTKYLPPRFMTMAQAAAQLMEAEERCHEQAYDPAKTLCVGLARMGQASQKIVAGTLNEIKDYADAAGGPLHSLIVTGGNLHDLEVDFLKSFLLEGSCYELEALPEPEKEHAVVEDNGDAANHQS